MSIIQPSGPEQLLVEWSFLIVALHQAPLLEHGHDTVNEVDEGAGSDRIHQVEAVDACLAECLQCVSVPIWLGSSSLVPLSR